MSQRNPYSIVTTGSNGTGAVTLTGAKKGDLVSGIANLTTPGDLRTSFETVISVADQIQQTAATNLSAAQVQVQAIPQGAPAA